jgi:translocation and assembly module TamB
MRFGRRQRKILLALGLLLGALGLLWFSLPAWLPWVLRPLARTRGATYSTYERLGYRRFALNNVTFTNRNITLNVKRLDAWVPTVWLWRGFVVKSADPFLTANDWQLQIVPSTAKRTNAPASVHHIAQIVAGVFQGVQRWAPAATVSNGTINVRSTAITLRKVSWSGADLHASVALKPPGFEANLAATLGKTLPSEIRIESGSLNLLSRIQLSLTPAELTLHSTNSWFTNQFTLDARFDPQTLLPRSALLQAPEFHLPASELKLKGYSDLAGSLSADWNTNQFRLHLTASAQPLPNQTNLPPVHVEISSHGDTNYAGIESALITAPGLSAKLSENVKLYFQGEILRQVAAFDIQADLKQQPWSNLTGSLAGRAEFVPVGKKFPDLRFRVSGSDIGNEDVKARTVAINGGFDFPVLEFRELRAQFADSSFANVRATLDLNKKEVVSATVRFGGPLLQRWLPSGWSYDDYSLEATLSGPFKAPTHNARLNITNITSPNLKPFHVQAQWTGNGLNLDPLELRLSSSNVSLQCRTAVSGGTNIGLNSLTLTEGSSPVLELAQPTHLRIAPRSSHNPRWRVELDPFIWRGSAGELQVEADVSWPHLGRLNIEAKNMQSDLVHSFLNAHIEPFKINSLAASAAWSNGPAITSLQCSGTGMAGNIPFDLQVHLHGDSHALILSNLVINSDTSSVAVAHANLPLTIHPGAGTNVIQLDGSKPIDFSLSTKPQGLLWQKFTEWTGAVLQDPDCNVSLSGTWDRPDGTIDFRARQVDFPHARQQIPTLSDIRLHLTMDRDRARLTEAQVLVQDQPVILTAEMPLGHNFWLGLKQKHLPDWQQTSAHLQINHAQLAPFAPLVPKVMSPQGTVNLDLSLAPGGKISGDLQLEKGRTRPLGTLGPIRDINLRLKFLDRFIQLEEARASVGGSTVLAHGKGDLSGTKWLKGGVPPFQFVIQGTNVPLSRQPESVIRSDLDLSIVKTNDLPPLITGTVNLRDSFYLRDVRALIPGKVSSPQRRPPYFSIEEPSLSDWRLATRVSGNRFLRVRSTLFNGEVSANLHLEGTLKDPIALGDVKIDSGTVRFPFASLRVQQGFVALSSEDPYRPQLLVSATSKKFGYDLKMDASGPVDAPVLQFSSTPPLNSEQIVLMVTAGELPKAELTLSPQQKAQTVAVFFGRDLLGKLGFGDDSEDRLTIQSGEQISEQGRPTYSLEYKLTDRWALTGEYDRFNAFNAGLKWRVYSK